MIQWMSANMDEYEYEYVNNLQRSEACAYSVVVKRIGKSYSLLLYFSQLLQKLQHIGT